MTIIIKNANDLRLETARIKDLENQINELDSAHFRDICRAELVNRAEGLREAAIELKAVIYEKWEALEAELDMIDTALNVNINIGIRSSKENS